MKGDGKESV